MSLTVLGADDEKTLGILSRQDLLRSFYLAGGTGCALHIGHRLSHDFDFFSPAEFDVFAIQNSLRNQGRFVIDYSDANTLVGRFEGTKISHHVLKSLVYFADADKEPEPEMLVDFSWDAAKRFFVASVRAFGSP